jgi:hypothetical protein
MAHSTSFILLPLLYHQSMLCHPFIEYLQPEPGPPPLNSYLILFLLIHWTYNTYRITKSGIIIYIIIIIIIIITEE